MDKSFPAMRFKHSVLSSALAAMVVLAVTGCGGSDVGKLTTQLKDEDEDVRYDAVKALEGMGDTAKEAVPALTEALSDQDPKVRYRAAKALSKIGANAAAVPALSEALKDNNPDVVYYAAKSLEALGTDAEPAVPGLIQALQSKQNEKAHYYVLKTLRNVGPGAAEAIPAVKSALDAKDQTVRDAAASALRKLEKHKK